MRESEVSQRRAAVAALRSVVTGMPSAMPDSPASSNGGSPVAPVPAFAKADRLLNQRSELAEMLGEALHDEDAQVRRSVATTLRAIGSAASPQASALASVLHDSDIR